MPTAQSILKPPQRSQSPGSKKSRKSKSVKMRKIVRKSCQQHSSAQAKAKFDSWKKKVVDIERSKALLSM